MPNAQCHLAAESCVNLTRLTPGDVYLVTTPLYHANAPLMQVYPALVAGARAVLLPRFSAREWLARARATGAAWRSASIRRRDAARRRRLLLLR
jgi:crotonobetaine/carnitine-CoA ligase